MKTTLEKIRAEVSCIVSGYYFEPVRTSEPFVLKG
jgi:hypothetical protein